MMIGRKHQKSGSNVYSTQKTILSYCPMHIGNRNPHADYIPRNMR